VIAVGGGQPKKASGWGGAYASAEEGVVARAEVTPDAAAAMNRKLGP
jgi:hypothetical protein